MAVPSRWHRYRESATPILGCCAETRENIAVILDRLCGLGASHQEEIVRAGGILELIRFSSCGSLQTRNIAVIALADLAKGNTANQTALALAGAIKPLVDLLSQNA